jgi:hypothetical protein
MSAISRWRSALLAMLLQAGYPAFIFVARWWAAVTPFNRQKYIDRRQRRRDRIETGHALAVLHELQRIAAKTGAAMFPVSGTLLGLHRNGGILAHDVDIDVGLFAGDRAANRNACRSATVRSTLGSPNWTAMWFATNST